MNLAYQIVTLTIKGLTSILCNVDDGQLQQVPANGPLILAANHINFLDIPVIYTRLQPRPVTGLVKAETWNNPIMATLFDLWGGIPVRRGEADKTAIRRALFALRAGQIVAIAPEGTRSGDGRLQAGHPGIVLLALHSGAPILPIAYYGGECFQRNISHLQRTDFHIAVGTPFHLKPSEGAVSHQVRQKMLDEIMCQIAALLPSIYQGIYANRPATVHQYLLF